MLSELASRVLPSARAQFGAPPARGAAGTMAVGLRANTGGVELSAEAEWKVVTAALLRAVGQPAAASAVDALPG